MTDARRDRNDVTAEEATADEPRTDDRLALAATVGLLVVPVTVIAGESTYTLVSLWGLVTVAIAPGGDVAVSGYPIWRYLLEQPLSFGALPTSVRAWPLALAFHLLALASAATGVAWGREDRRVTAGLLVLAGIASLSVAVGIGSRYGLGPLGAVWRVVPMAAIGAWGCAIALYGPALRELLGR
ncbi:TIGR04206 family protein [Halopenitus persicus]|uniref:TIGR04206 family protein n=1 Tax=Halopenitus persicus TaxID=1048396 RepID=UPI000BBA45E9|nr:TIGR04206 family protein [Halopenitus persicus]